MERYEVIAYTAKRSYTFEIDAIEDQFTIYSISKNFWQHSQSRKIGKGKNIDAALAIIRIYTGEPIEDLQIQLIPTDRLIT